MYRILRYGVALTVALLSLTAQADLQEQLDALEPGASFELPPEQISSLAIRVPGVSVSCHAETVIDPGGQGNAVDIVAERVTFSGCAVRGEDQSREATKEQAMLASIPSMQPD